MRFGEMIKKAWHITWRYRWLWVLGVFAGVTGGGGGAGGGGSNTSGYQQSFGSGSGGSGLQDLAQFQSAFQHWLPLIFVAIVLLFVIGIAFAVIGIGARGGLVWAVNEIEDGRSPRPGSGACSGWDCSSSCP
jgi:hypothetical protein